MEATLVSGWAALCQLAAPAFTRPTGGHVPAPRHEMAPTGLSFLGTGQTVPVCTGDTIPRGPVVQGPDARRCLVHVVGYEAGEPTSWSARLSARRRSMLCRIARASLSRRDFSRFSLRSRLSSSVNWCMQDIAR